MAPAVACFRPGYREAFIGEHLVDSAETITSSLAFVAHLADACPSITFGTGVLPLANYRPAMAAAQVAMVDHLVQGRLVLGFGPGVSADAEAIGDTCLERLVMAGTPTKRWHPVGRDRRKNR